MIDSDNVVVQCPNGHQVQAARTHLHLVLACPVCSTHFVPVPATTGGAHNLAYADGQVGLPVRRPGYTRWLIGLWIAATAAGLIYSAYAFVSVTAVATNVSATAPPAFDPLMMLFACMTGPVTIAAMVLQVMWIYRIHNDARQAGYSTVSPGLALGLSFVPYFQYPWTAWTLRKLAGFAAQAERANNADAVGAVRIAGVCFMLGLVHVTVGMVVGVMTANYFVKGFMMAMQSGAMQRGTPPPVEIPSYLMFASIPSAVVSIIAVLVYVCTVHRVERSLYDFLGAPPRT